MSAGTKAFEVIGVNHDGEEVCRDCMTPLEERVADDAIEIPDVEPILAEDASRLDCDRCGCPLVI